MKTVDFGVYSGKGSQVIKESGALAAGEEVLVKWKVPAVATGGDFIVTQPLDDALISAAFHNKTKTGTMDVRFGFGAPALVPNSDQSCAVKVDRATSGLSFKLTIKSR